MSDKSANITPSRWDDLMFLRTLRDRFGGDLGAHLAELTEEQRARLERLNEKLKERHSWRKF